MIILIPAYKPGNELIKLVKDLNYKFEIIIVDDGSGEEYENIYIQLKKYNCKILKHETNMGKGLALKTGFKYINTEVNEKDGIICADCDGQHLVKDIVRASQYILVNRGMVLGCRDFNKSTPLRSKIGNTIMRKIFSNKYGVNIRDTQTGLRGYSMDMLDFLISTKGCRFEYETNLLIKAIKNKMTIGQIDIETIYKNKNKGTNYRAIKSSIQILSIILKNPKI